MEYIKQPMDIENGSMSIIESEMASPKSFTDSRLKIVKRVIHTTADFEYESLIRFSNNVVDKMLKAVEDGKKIYADTNMISVAVNRVLLKKNNIEIVNYVHDEDVVTKANELGVTRSMVAIEKAFFDETIGIYLIGNAPTALLRLMELSAESNKRPDVIVGVPVGFVGAKESKDELIKSNHSYISIVGRKGGSPVAAAIMNAVLKIHEDKLSVGGKNGL